MNKYLLKVFNFKLNYIFLSVLIAFLAYWLVDIFLATFVFILSLSILYLWDPKVVSLLGILTLSVAFLILQFLPDFDYSMPKTTRDEEMVLLVNDIAIYAFGFLLAGALLSLRRYPLLMKANSNTVKNAHGSTRKN